MATGDPADVDVTEAMIRLGGSFVEALGHLFRLADSDNTRRLKVAFPEYWQKYAVLAASQATRTRTPPRTFGDGHD